MKQDLGTAISAMGDGRAVERDRAAESPARTLEAFVVEHHTRLVRLAALVCGEITAAEDIVQDALLRAWKARASLRGDAPIRPWLDRIVVREAARERRSRWSRLSRLIALEHPASATRQPVQPVDRAASAFPEAGAVRDALARLTAAQRAVVVLHHDAGYGIDEVAQLLGIPRETVRSRLRVAREHLRRELGEGR